MAPANKGTYLLIAALWETYCEDVLAETAALLIAGISDPKQLPVAIQRAVAKDIKEDKHELSPWDLADDGWRSIVQRRAARLFREVAFNSPKSTNVDDLFRRTLGIGSISKEWSTDRAENPASQLDFHLHRRGELAHRAASVAITKQQVSDFYQLTTALTRSTDLTLGRFLQTATGHDPYAARETPETPPEL